MFKIEKSEKGLSKEAIIQRSKTKRSTEPSKDILMKPERMSKIKLTEN